MEATVANVAALPRGPADQCGELIFGKLNTLAVIQTRELSAAKRGSVPADFSVPGSFRVREPLTA